MMDDPEELPLISSSPMLDTAPAPVKPQDEMDLPGLVKIQLLMIDQIASYSHTDQLTEDETIFTMRQQLAINKAIAYRLNEVKVLTDSIISRVMEKYE